MADGNENFLGLSDRNIAKLHRQQKPEKDLSVLITAHIIDSESTKNWF
jgi:hypothetical protein